MGHSFYDMVKSCTFQGLDCMNETYFKITSSPTYGNCFTFNAMDNYEKDPFAGKRVATLTGTTYGLTLVLNIDQGAYLKNGETKQAGARIAIHESKKTPLVDEFGLDILPNTLTNIGIQEIRITRQPSPYVSNCTKDWSLSNYTAHVPENWNYSIAVRFFFHFEFKLYIFVLSSIVNGMFDHIIPKGVQLFSPFILG